jgi:hypothetical protein
VVILLRVLYQEDYTSSDTASPRLTRLFQCILTYLFLVDDVGAK